MDTISLAFFLLEAFQLLFVSERVRHFKSAKLTERIEVINAVLLLADILIVKVTKSILHPKIQINVNNVKNSKFSCY